MGVGSVAAVPTMTESALHPACVEPAFGEGQSSPAGKSFSDSPFPHHRAEGANLQLHAFDSRSSDSICRKSASVATLHLRLDPLWTFGNRTARGCKSVSK